MKIDGKIYKFDNVWAVRLKGFKFKRFKTKENAEEYAKECLIKREMDKNENFNIK